MAKQKTTGQLVGAAKLAFHEARTRMWRADVRFRTLYDRGVITKSQYDQIGKRLNTIEDKFASLEDYIADATWGGR